MTRQSNALSAGSRLAPAAAPALPAVQQPPLEQWGAPPQPAQTAPGYQRYIAALARFKWLIVAMVLLGLLGGYIATRYVKPEFVHVFVGGRIVESGGPELAEELDANGYERFTQAVGA